MTRTALQRITWIVSAIAVVAVLAWQLLAPNEEVAQREETPRRDAPVEHRGSGAAPTASRDLDLPPQAHATLDAIRRGGPFPYRQDGAVFQNREGHLPAQPRGYYREYTVETPGSRDRGPRRIVTGGDPPTEYFYTSDHYRSFRRIEVSR